MSQRERVAVIILNYNKKQDALACLESVQRLEWTPSRVVFVDNGSTDGSADAAAQAFPSVHVVRHATNLGAAGGRNAGWRYVTRQASFDHVLFLDNDTVLNPHFLSRLVDGMRRDPRAGIVCGKGYTRFPSRTIMSAGIVVNLYTGVVRDRGAGQVDHGRYDRSEYVDACGGFGFLVRQRVMAELGGLDERFNPYGWEDVEFCLRAKARGHRTRYVPEAVIYHHGGKLGRSYLLAYERLKVRNYLFLLMRHTTLLQRFSCAVCLPVRAIGLIGTLMAHGQARILAAHWQGLREGINARQTGGSS